MKPLHTCPPLCPPLTNHAGVAASCSSWSLRSFFFLLGVASQRGLDYVGNEEARMPHINIQCAPHWIFSQKKKCSFPWACRYRCRRYIVSLSLAVFRAKFVALESSKSAKSSVLRVRADICTLLLAVAEDTPCTRARSPSVQTAVLKRPPTSRTEAGR